MVGAELDADQGMGCTLPAQSRKPSTSMSGQDWSIPTTCLIDVGQGDESPIVYLCDTNSLPEPPSALKYATLSHTWGGVLAKKLVKESIHEFQRGIRVLDLQKIFQEAIHVTRKPSVKYLWVDDLCVIQNSEKDWLVESSKMEEKYLNSYINLAAPASGDSRGGLFQMNNLFMSSLCQILGSRAQQAPTTYTCCLQTRLHDNIERAPLNRRAWVFEREH